MDDWILFDGEGYYRINDKGIVSVSPPAGDLHCPVLIAPAITYRKYFQLPDELEADPEQFKLSFFSKSLPGKVNQYRIQFLSGTRENEYCPVLALAVKNDVLERCLKDWPDSPVYFLETVFYQIKFKTDTVLEIPFLSGGSYIAYYSGIMSWSRYVKNPEQMAPTYSYIETNFSEEYEKIELPESKREEKRKKWSRDIASFFPRRLPGNLNLRETAGAQKIWSKIRLAVTVVLILLCLTFLLQAWVDLQHSRSLENWMIKKYESEFDKKMELPIIIDNLTKKTKNIKQRVKLTSDMDAHFYPRLVKIDREFEQFPVRLLRMDLGSAGGELTFLAASLGEAETLQSSLADEGGFSGVEIVSTRSLEVERFNYEVTISFEWDGN